MVQLPRIGATHAAVKLQDLPGGQMVRKTGILRKISDLTENRTVLDRFAEQPYVAAIRMGDRQCNLYQGRLSRSILTQQSEYGAPLNGKADVLKRSHLAFGPPMPERFGDGFDLEHRRHMDRLYRGRMSDLHHAGGKILPDKVRQGIDVSHPRI